MLTIERRNAVNVVYINFVKAFDKDEIGILFNKLSIKKTSPYIINYLDNL